MAKKWPGMVVQRTFIKGHSFVYRLYLSFSNWISRIEIIHQLFMKFVQSIIDGAVVAKLEIDGFKSFNTIFYLSYLSFSLLNIHTGQSHTYFSYLAMDFLRFHFIDKITKLTTLNCTSIVHFMRFYEIPLFQDQSAKDK